MSTNPPSRSYGVASGRFWRNVTLIALAHIALIAGLIRWSVAAKSAPDAESLVWLSGAEDVAAGATKREARPELPASPPLPEPQTLKTDEAEEEKPLVTAAKSEIDLPTPNPTSTPKPAPKSPPKAMAKPTPKPTPRKTVLAKASKSSITATSRVPKPKEAQTNANIEKKKSTKAVSSKTKSSSDSGNGKTGSAGKGDSAGGASNASEFGWYGNMLHDRFYSAWIQPTSSVPSGAKISTLVKVRIEKDGRVSKFEIIKPSENVVVNESVAAIAKRVSEVDAPPAGLVKGDYYDVRINFELNTGEGMGNQ
jgi:outer membrane biosynthesis protein TonB